MKTLIDMLKHSCSSYGDKPVLMFKEQEWTYHEMDVQSNKIANELKNMGIKHGDRVGLLMANHPYFVICYYAIVKLGAVVVPINIMFKGNEIEYLLNDSSASALITTTALLPTVKEVETSFETVKNIVVLQLSEDHSTEGYITVDDLLKKGEDNLELDYTVGEEDTAVFLYTSGTTGHPKGAMLSHKNLVANAISTSEVLKNEADDVAMCVLPMFHSFAWTVIVTMSILKGGSIVVMESFVPHSVVSTMVSRKVSIFAGVPTMYNVLLHMEDLGQSTFAHIKTFISGGASLPVEVLRKVDEKFGIKIVEGYGLSECSPVCTLNPLNGIRKAGSIGLVLPHVECKIIDENGQEVPRNESGELAFRGPNVMKGYFNLPDATKEALKDGWMHTGDIGYMDDEGYIFIIDRKKDLIIVGGLNVYPREIEEVLYRHPKISEAAVISMNDELRGEVVKAVVVLKQGQTATEREIIRFCQNSLANYKLPKVVEFRESLPKTSTGKILKRALKQ